MRALISSFLAGGLFGAGLLVSEMTNPAKVLGFLDIFGLWDPSLLLVMLGAVPTAFVGYQIVLRREKPVFSDMFHLPTSKDIDRKLVWGSVIFGIGWGLGGLCPGPAIASASFAGPDIVLFITAMLVGIFAGRLINKLQQPDG